eukprot:scaffold1954_cov268-Pinguiococcus_pyrenoidosus.AAC.87
MGGANGKTRASRSVVVMSIDSSSKRERRRCRASAAIVSTEPVVARTYLFALGGAALALDAHGAVGLSPLETRSVTCGDDKEASAHLSPTVSLDPRIHPSPVVVSPLPPLDPTFSVATPSPLPWSPRPCSGSAFLGGGAPTASALRFEPPCQRALNLQSAAVREKNRRLSDHAFSLRWVGSKRVWLLPESNALIIGSK